MATDPNNALQNAICEGALITLDLERLLGASTPQFDLDVRGTTRRVASEADALCACLEERRFAVPSGARVAAGGATAPPGRQPQAAGRYRP